MIHGGNVYWAFSGVHCLDFRTGKQRWHGGRVGSQGSCIVTSDERLIVWANRGDLLLVETARRSPGAYRELARLSGLARTDAWPHAVLAGGRLYLRDRSGRIQCLAVSSQAKRAAATKPTTGKPDRARRLQARGNERE